MATSLNNNFHGRAFPSKKKCQLRANALFHPSQCSLSSTPEKIRERNIILKSFIKLKHQLMKLRLSTSSGETYRCALFCNLESLQPAKITY